MNTMDTPAWSLDRRGTAIRTTLVPNVAWWKTPAFMSATVPCRLCGARILPVTAERTGGTCMPCFKGPVPQDPSVLARWLAANLSSAQILAILDRTLVEVCKRVAHVAVDHQLGEEGIYGFWLSHHVFTNVYATVFTEAGLDAATRRYHEKGRLDVTRDELRWSRADSPHHLYLEPVTAQTEVLFSALEHQGRDEAVDTEIERSMLRALRYTRRAGIFAPSVVLVLAEADHSPEELLVAAEQLSDPATVARFRSELIPLREDYLALLRSRVPEY